MGAFLSVSGHGHSSHPEHCARFNRVDRSDSPPSPCRMCKLTVELGAVAYRCSEPGCAVVLHDACYRRPTTLKRHFGHPNHPLILGADTRAAGVSCGLCAQPLGTPTVAYSCACAGTGSRCAGFSAHPRCCHLLKSMSAPPELHRHARLVLRPPPPAASGGNREDRPPRRTCVKCRKTAATTTTTAGRKKKAAPPPWSYQCPNPKCVGVEYCLACVLGNGDDDDRTVRCCCGLPCCDDVDPAAVHWVGYLAGVLFCGFLSGIGCLRIPTQPYPGDMEDGT